MKTLPVTYSIEQRVLIAGLILAALVVISSCDRMLTNPDSSAWATCFDHGDWKNTPYCNAAAKEMPNV